MIVQESESQQPIYFISRTLQESEGRYQLLEKVALGLVHTARRLRQYFQGHQVIVRTDCPISKVLRKPELAGRMMAWSIELSKFDISFEPRGPIKSQCLADFANELQPKGHFQSSTWTMHVDGSSNNQGSGAGIILEGPTGVTLEQSLHFAFKASNNQAEYEALLVGLRLAHEVGVAITVSTICATNSKKFNMETNECLAVSESETSRTNTPWITTLLEFILHGKEPPEDSAARKLRTQAAHFSVIGTELYKRGFSTPLFKCIGLEQADYVLREIHEGICGSHSGGRTLAAKVLRVGYYWPTLKGDCAQFVKRCVQCQKHGNLIHASAEQLHSVSSSWPFALWGMDILGPFPIAKGQDKFLLVAIDYFTKWIEAEPLATITVNNVQKFMWKNVITHFGFPQAIVTDNGLQFTD
ncbi:uncharacterized protein LOC109811395 [Cajanus cajan]|uniref:uncharacterized protein LOC109811395 n=1 Tax=Cajanus cajan TaxID=3821 RepID=UPI00098DD434|nr:uncharacterized protein LOC109811395 [Cajanus cajan]